MHLPLGALLVRRLLLERAVPMWPAGRRAWSIAALRVLAVASVALAAGGLTSFGQGWLPESISSVANSVSGWTAVVVLLIWATRQRALVPAALSGLVGFVMLNLGYQLVSNARGFFYSGEVWFVIGIVVGPFIGAATSWLHRRDVLAALGSGLLSGIGISEAADGLLLLPTTSPVYWSISGSGALLLLAVCLRRLPTVRLQAVAVLTTAAMGVLFWVSITAIL